MADAGMGNGAGRGSSRDAGESSVRVLIVDDEGGVRNAISRVLRNAGMLPSTAESGASALELLGREPFDVALLDVRMPGMTGPQVLARMKEANHPAEVIMMTAFADIATTVSAVKAGAYGFLTKPFVTNESIVIEVQNAAGHKRLREHTERLQRELADLRPEDAAIPPFLPGEPYLPTVSDESDRAPARIDRIDAVGAMVAALSLHELDYADARRRVLAKFTDAYVAAVLRITGGDVSEAARRSGLDRSWFGRLLPPNLALAGTTASSEDDVDG